MEEKRCGAGPKVDSLTTSASSAPRHSIRNVLLKSILALVAILYFLQPYGQVIVSSLSFHDGASPKSEESGSDKPPNIVFIMTDDQDGVLGSIDYMKTVQKKVIREGINFVNHFGTTALCCPGRATLFRGQAAHNTNITHVGGTGGGYVKWRRTGEWKSYLPHWLRQAGYTTAYFGKFLNGYGLHTYHLAPEGWDLTEILTGPYLYNFKHVVTSTNGERPVYYPGWHQIDVLRLKALAHLDWMMGQEKPFYLEVAPVTPHVRPGGTPTVPPKRYKDTFAGLKAPRIPNWNPAQGHTDQKVAWLRDLPAMNESIIHQSDLSYQRRVEALQGVDELVHDVIKALEKKGVLDNTYIIYTSDNGFHLGNHRLPGGKGQAYREDTNLPFAVRGPGIPTGKVSKIPQAHLDVAPTLLDIAGLPTELWPPFFDGRSLLEEWQSLTTPNDTISREVLNVEFWGSTTAAAGPYTKHWPHNSYKSLRIVSENQGYLFSRWCFSNQTELYNTTADPYELTNLAINPSNETTRLMDRLSGLLLVTKSCGQDTCRRPWEVLRSGWGSNATFYDLETAMSPIYDSFFASLPHFGFKECMGWQATHNEGPYYPPESESLGSHFREWLPGPEVVYENNYTLVSESEEERGDWAQRFAYVGDVMKIARPLTDEEIGWPVVRCDEENDWCGAIWDDD